MAWSTNYWFHSVYGVIMCGPWEDYMDKLRKHDWYYEYSDDHGVWRRGSDERDQLRRLQEEIDSDYKVWNQYAPDMFKR